jgi:hypothetical protein
VGQVEDWAVDGVGDQFIFAQVQFRQRGHVGESLI